MDLEQMKANATSDVRTIRSTAGIEFASLNLVIATCNTDGDGNSWRVTAVGVYQGPNSVQGSQALIGGWAAKLAEDGWKPSGYGASSQTLLARQDAKLTLTRNNPQAVDPNDLNFEYFGPCGALSDADQDDVRAGDGAPQNILAQVQ